MKALVCSEDFLPQVIGQSILTTNERFSEVVHVNIAQHKRGTYDFTWKFLIGKNNEEDNELHYNSQVISVGPEAFHSSFDDD